MNIIPKPKKAIEKSGRFTLSASTGYYMDAAFAAQEPFLNSLIGKSLQTPPAACAQDDAAVKFLKDETLPADGYKLSVTENAITAYAADRGGILYAMQTLRQLFDADLHTGVESLTAPCCEIEDAPRYKWRGMMLDSSRHFWDVAAVKRYLDLMFRNKINVFHWHLTDDQGWRIEIKKYPLLTEIGSKRKDTEIHGWKSLDMEGKPYGGFYTQEEIREIVHYADERNIMVVPEVDMPAHFAAAMAAYNWLGCREIPCEVHWFFGGFVPKHMNWPDWNRSACAGKETTYEFIFNVLDELAELFPAPYFHIGGDEAPKDEWKKCPECQKRMAENGLKNVDELQGYFNNRVAEHLKQKGKRLIVWNEALKANNLDKSVVGQYWTPQRDRYAEKYVNNGGEMILSKHQAFYFDMYYAQYPLPNTYKFEPEKVGVKPEAQDRILGVEGEVWTEFIGEQEKLDLNTHPRMEALAEVGWTPRESRDFADFMARMHHEELALAQLGVNCAVDEVAIPKGRIKRLRTQRMFYTCDQHVEMRRNREYRKIGKKE